MNPKPFFSALRFLTILPVPESWCGDESSFRKSPDWYPLVGLTIGLLLALLDLILCWLLPTPVANVFLLLAMIAISGALHLDGLADSADAFFSSRGREQMLEIMKDSRSGPMGVTAIMMVLFLKLMLLMTLPEDWRRQVIVLMPLAGRCVLPVLSSWLPYARTDGTASFAANTFSWKRLFIALVMLTIPSLFFLGWLAGIGIPVVVIFGGWLAGLYSRRKIGGFTGDTLGATCELIELLPALSIVALAHQGII
ncbi:adenosylcobinamide-GDP ribazoletransferase [uncultured Desulfuromusa sp.]|uniref:adenosylcobinamide-GDP ribazoletransferase n=1 Tax=uncultured Desulfuromusa sp. TaxID=219183 RepID=UPI002AA865ED|nr:adenosylcobinamide-GDP ribazoletransferase [uncultured Desulfuromusa sp.]